MAATPSFLSKLAERVLKTKYGKRMVQSKIGGEIKEDLKELNNARLWIYSSATGFGGVGGGFLFSMISWSVSRREPAKEFSTVNNKLDKLLMDGIQSKSATGTECPTSSRSFTERLKRIFPLPWQR